MADVSAPESVEKGTIFTVTATITNVGQGLAVDCRAAITVAGAAGLAAGEPPTRSLGSLSAGQAVSRVWTIDCLGAGQALIEVGAGGTDDTMGAPIPAERLEAGECDVWQWSPLLYFPVALKSWTVAD